MRNFTTILLLLCISVLCTVMLRSQVYQFDYLVAKFNETIPEIPELKENSTFKLSNKDENAQLENPIINSSGFLLACPAMDPNDVDNDGDDVSDINDVDDDNDGISDELEGLACSDFYLLDLDGLAGSGSSKNISYFNGVEGGMTNLTISEATTNDGAVLKSDEDGDLELEPGNGKAGISISESNNTPFTVVVRLERHISGQFNDDSSNGVSDKFDIDNFSNTNFIIEGNVNNDPILINSQSNGKLLFEANNSNTGTFGNYPDFKIIIKSTGSPVFIYAIESNPFTTINVSVQGCDILDTDGDTIPDHLDLDSDNDGIPDAIEGCSGVEFSDLIDCRLPMDETAVTSEGCPTGATTMVCSNPENTDISNDDLPNYLDLDSDNDGCSDSNEAGTAGAGVSDNTYTTTNIGDGLAIACTEPVDNTWKNSSDFKACCPKPTAEDVDTDGDGVPDSVDVDDDNDGLSDEIESTQGYKECSYFEGPNTGKINHKEWIVASDGAVNRPEQTTSYTADPNNFHTTGADGLPTAPEETNANYTVQEITLDVTALENLNRSKENSRNFSELTQSDAYVKIPGSECLGASEISFRILGKGIGRYAIWMSKTGLPSDAIFSGEVESVSGNQTIPITNDTDPLAIDEDGEIIYFRGYLIDNELNAVIQLQYTIDAGDNYQNVPIEWISPTFDDAALSGVTNIIWMPDGNGSFTDGNGNTETESNLIARGAELINIDRDTDGDGIADHLDLDSDNDGIPDAIEGCSGVVFSDLADCRLPMDDTAVTALGCPTGAAINKGCTKAENSDENLPGGDDLPDYLDLDSDADGCSDSNEGGTAGPGVSDDTYTKTNIGDGLTIACTDSDDGQWQDEFRVSCNDYDFGDLPRSYGSAMSQNPKETNGNDAVWIGIEIDFEFVAEGETAIEDGDDEDGISEFPQMIIGNQSFDVDITLNSTNSNKPVYYGLWIDWENNGTFSDNSAAATGFYTGSIITSSPVTESITITTPSNYSGSPENLNYRLRASDEAIQANDFQGLIENGETEDYNVASVLLPVELISFTAEKRDEKVVLNWETATELNNEKFELEYSLDGIRFQRFAEVAGQGTTREATNYVYTHEEINQLGARQIFYRIRQVDFDGTASYSEIEVVVIVTLNDLTVYPVPAEQGEQIIISSTKNLDGYKIYNMIGILQIVGQKSNATKISISTSQLQPGKYIVVFKNGEQVQFIVQ